MNEIDFKKTIDILHPNGEVFELRVIDGGKMMSGYFNSASVAWEEVKKYPNETFYIIFNQINSGCMSRLQGGKMLSPSYGQKLQTTSDNDIIRRKWIFIDIDPIRPSGVSSTDEEKEQAYKTIKNIFRYLRSVGFEDPVIFDSGNGYGMFYSVDLPVDNKTTQVVKKFLETISMLFDNEHCEIDTSVYNLARLAKCVPTIAKKGRSTAERPHRESKYIYIPENIKPTSLNLIQQVIENNLVSEEVEPPSYKNNFKSFDIDEFIHKHGIQVAHEVSSGGVRKLVLQECVFNSNHKSPDAAIFVLQNGALAYKCFHNSCCDKGWKDVRSHFEPNWTDIKQKEQRATPNFASKTYKPATITKNRVIDNGEPAFYTMPQIAALPNQDRKLIPTGYVSLDKKIGGLAKGEVTVLSAKNGAGKSTLITQMELNMIDAGYRVALFSGEFTAQRARKWICHIAAGKRYAIKSKFDDTSYYISDDIRSKIDKWADDKLFIYNNNQGNNFDDFCVKLNKCVEDNKVDIIFLDNLASLDITTLGKTELEAQKVFINTMVAFAQANDIHVFLVIHPNKSQPIIVKENVSGSGDLTNRVDNVLLLHRVDDEFKRNAPVVLRWSSNDPLLEASNLLQIAKDRENGTVDFFIPLFFEAESKRLKGHIYENKIYGWENVTDPLDEIPM